jgi:hypothetical protein
MSEMNGFKDASDGAAGKFEDSPLGKKIKDKETNGNGKTNYDAPIAREIKVNGMDERDNPEKTRMEPSVRVIFNCKDKYDKAEFERQVKNQEKGMNNLTLDDFIKNRDNFKENGRDLEVGGPAQEKVRQEARADRIAENRQNGMSRDAAEKKADQWLESQAALHDPDQIAGGGAANVTGMGDKEINSSIGSQWQYRIDAVDTAVQKYIAEKNLSKEDLKKVYLNVKLEVASE